jgi:hypothetical protein
MTGTFRPGTLLANSDGVLAGPVVPAGLPLDIAPGAAAAWSLRKLSASYAGMAVNVRRSTDNATQDIGFVGNDFDLASFNAFIGGGSGFVATWYDQSGHGLNLTQATAANQPAIATAVGPLNGRPALNFMTAANNVLSNLAGIPGIFTGASPGLISTVCNVNNISATIDAGLARPVGAANPNVIGLTLPHSTGVFLQLTAGFTPILIARWSTSSDAGLGGHVIEASYQWIVTATPIFTVDGSTNATTVIVPPAGTPGTDTGTAFNLAAVNTGGANPFTGHIAEQIAWPAVPVNMSAVRNGQRAYWITVLPLDYAAAAAAAWSLRKLSSSYAGACCNVRRSTDNATQDIGFVGNDFDVTSFNTFIAAGQGFVVTWYDQSGHGNHAIAPTQAQQPQLTPNLATLNSRPALVYGSGTNFALNIQASPSLANIFANGGFTSSVVTVDASPPATGSNRLWNKGNAIRAVNSAVTTKLSLIQVTSGTAGTWITTNALAVGAHLVDIAYSSASLANLPTISFDSAAQTFSTSTQPTGTVSDDTGASLQLGNIGAGGNGWNGALAEMIFWPSQPAPGPIRTSQKAYWGTP